MDLQRDISQENLDSRNHRKTEISSTPLRPQSATVNSKFLRRSLDNKRETSNDRKDKSTAATVKHSLLRKSFDNYKKAPEGHQMKLQFKAERHHADVKIRP